MSSSVCWFFLCQEKIKTLAMNWKQKLIVFGPHHFLVRARSLYSMVKESSDMTKRVPTRKKNRFFSFFFIFPSDMTIFHFSMFLFIPLTSVDSDDITVSQNTFTISTRYIHQTLAQQAIKTKLNSRLCRIDHEN